jgi:GT2 family glycosyltransferase
VTAVGAIASSAAAEPLVSVIIPCYNAEKTLCACLRSASAQTYPSIEIIVVDDKSSDRSRAIAREFRCTLIEQPRNKGVSAARNAGAAVGRGEILFFLDSDVALARDAVTNAVRLLRDHPGCGCAYGCYAAEPLVDDGPVETYRTLHLHHVLTRGAGQTATAVFALAAVPRQAFETTGPFNENLRSAEDDEYSERLLAHRYHIRLTRTVVGRHDEAERLLPLLAEQFRRAQLLRLSARNRLRRGSLKVTRASSLLAAALAVVTVPFVAVQAWLLAVPLAFLLIFACTDLSLSRFVLREKGASFLGYFTIVHFLVHLTLIAGAGTGVIRAIAGHRPGGASPRVAGRPLPAAPKDW